MNDKSELDHLRLSIKEIDSILYDLGKYCRLVGYSCFEDAPEAFLKGYGHQYEQEAIDENQRFH